MHNFTAFFYSFPTAWQRALLAYTPVQAPAEISHTNSIPPQSKSCSYSTAKKKKQPGPEIPSDHRWEDVGKPEQGFQKPQPVPCPTGFVPSRTQAQPYPGAPHFSPRVASEGGANQPGQKSFLVVEIFLFSCELLLAKSQHEEDTFPEIISSMRSDQFGNVYVSVCVCDVGVVYCECVIYMCTILCIYWILCICSYMLTYIYMVLYLHICVCACICVMYAFVMCACLCIHACIYLSIIYTVYEHRSGIFACICTHVHV